MRRISNANILATVVVIFLMTTVFTTVLSQQALQQQNNFDVVPGKLVYFDSGTGSSAGMDLGDSGTFVAFHDHARHYNKGNLRRIHFRKKQFDNEKNARRQGQQCFGVCRYIPDRDFCPTDIVPEAAEEYEAYDDYDEDYYSEEENSEEYYDDYEEDEEYSEEEDDYNEVDKKRNRNKGKKTNKPKKRLTEPRFAGGNRNETSQEGKMEGSSGGDGRLHVVYPSITKFAVGKAGGTGGNGENKIKKAEQRSRKSAGKRRRHRRLIVRGPIKMRPPALEQEKILIRWDHVFERGPYIGGDIVLPEGIFLRPPNFRFLRKQWPEGEIPFTMDLSLNTCRQNAILDAMDEIENKTCIRFVERDNERNYIDIRRAQTGCSSYVGMVGGAQHLNLSTGCFSKFTVTHELMHAIGFDHEQSRKDRDKFIDIDFDNVLREKEGQFELNPSFNGGGFPYDIRSIMHYSAFLFAKDKCEPTIYPINEKIDICEMGVGNGKGGMTDCDAAKINKMYKCIGKKYSKKCKIRN